MLEWVADVIGKAGYLGVFLLMLAENVFPPIPSELVMPLSGFAAQRGDLNLYLVVASGAAGSLAGALFWYMVGAWMGRVRLKRWAGRHGAWLTMGPDDVDIACERFNRNGRKTVLFGRVVPAVRTLISVPAGISDMPLARFLLFSALGISVWTGLLAAAGYLLGDRYERVKDWVSPLSIAVLAALVLWYLYRVFHFRRAPRAAG